MNYSCKGKVGILSIGLVLGLSIATHAQEQNRDFPCFMRRSDNTTVNLTHLCGHKGTSNSRNQATLSPTQKRDQLFKDFYQQVQSYPEGQEILAQADPDALFGKANLVCSGLREGTYEPSQVSQGDEPDLRRVANLEDEIVDRLARSRFCPEFRN